MNDESIKSNLELFFNMVRIYIIGFNGNKNNYLFPLMYSDKICNLIKIFYNNNDEIKDKMIFIESYYKIKKYLEEEYIKKQNFYPPYICSCGRCYFIKDSFPMSEEKCECGLIIGGKYESLFERENHFAIYYNENQKSYIESGRASTSNKFKINGKLLEDFKNEFIIEPIINKCLKLDNLLLGNKKINEQNFSEIFIKFIFLQQIYLEYKIGLMTENEKIKEFKKINLLEEIVSLNNKIRDYLETTRHINYRVFMNYFCESYTDFLEDTDCFKNKEKFYNFFNNLLKKEYLNQKFYNIEMNILTSISFEPDFNNNNLKYLLTASQYPDIEKLKKYISLYKKKPLLILKVFINSDRENDDIDKLNHLETINSFINSFAEENSNLISRENYETDNIEYYLQQIRVRNRSILNENGESPLDIQFKNFCESYKRVTNIMPIEINRNHPVKYILNDNKIKNEETVINKVYCHLIEIQNNYLKEIIKNYDNKKEISKEEIIIKNAIEQIKKEIPVQLATKSEIFSFNVQDDTLRSFEELFSFYSLKNIFNKENNKIDYSKYSEIKFKLNRIEQELVNIILTGKKLFSNEQITYKFYSDPYEIEEKTKNFKIFTELYNKKDINDIEKRDLLNAIENVNRYFLPNLENLIFYLIKENKYQGNQTINDVKLPSNLYFNEDVKRVLLDSSKFTINQLISIYEYIEEQIWDFIADRYVNRKYKIDGFWNNNRDKLNEYYNNENKRELKNDMLASLLIKFICRYLPYGSKALDESNDLFEMICKKNMNLPENIKKDLNDLKKKFGAKISDAIDITRNLVIKNSRNRNQVENNVVNGENQNGGQNNEEEEEEEKEEGAVAFG